MNTHSKIVLASDNAGKVNEFKNFFAAFDIEIVPQNQFQIKTPEETAKTFVENAIAKARFAARHTNLPALADDSGLIVPVLQNNPGIYSARYAGVGATAEMNIKKLLAELEPFSLEKRYAYFYCVLVLLTHPDDPAPLIVDGRWEGTVLDKNLGEGGFGYDPIFWVAELGKTAAQLSLAEKNCFSHRAKALNLLQERIREKLW